MVGTVIVNHTRTYGLWVSESLAQQRMRREKMKTITRKEERNTHTYRRHIKFDPFRDAISIRGKKKTK